MTPVPIEVAMKDRTVIGPLVYRLCGRDGEPLYIGCTKTRLVTRLSAHRGVGWWGAVAHVIVELFGSHEAAAAAERAAIEAERPRHNRAGIDRPWTGASVSRQRPAPLAPASGLSVAAQAGSLDLPDRSLAARWLETEVAAGRLAPELSPEALARIAAIVLSVTPSPQPCTGARSPVPPQGRGLSCGCDGGTSDGASGPVAGGAPLSTIPQSHGAAVIAAAAPTAAP